MEVHSNITCYTVMKMKGVVVPVYAVKALEWCAWSASHPSNLTPGERTPILNLIGGWVGIKAHLDTLEKRKTSCMCWEFNHDSLEVQPIA